MAVIDNPPFVEVEFHATNKDGIPIRGFAKIYTPDKQNDLPIEFENGSREIGVSVYLDPPSTIALIDALLTGYIQQQDSHVPRK